jgi:hypothetical protein
MPHRPRQVIVELIARRLGRAGFGLGQPRQAELLSQPEGTDAASRIAHPGLSQRLVNT